MPLFLLATFPWTLCSRKTACGFVSGTGPGISKADLPRVFEEGFTGEHRERKAATGMGLYLAKRLCDRLGLEVKLESKDGQGTTVFIGFPVGKLHRPESL